MTKAKINAVAAVIVAVLALAVAAFALMGLPADEPAYADAAKACPDVESCCADAEAVQAETGTARYV